MPQIIMYLISMKLKVVHFLSLMALLFAVTAEARFPEFSFCPLGGPPGWFNRLSGQSHRYYPPPPYPLQAPVIPYYRAYPYPVWQQRPAYFQRFRYRDNNH
jgi:hypothetical protein